MNRKARRAQQSGGCSPVGRNQGGADLIELSSVHQLQGRPHEAVRLLKQLLDREPELAAAHAALAAAYQKLDQRNRATRHFKKALSLRLRGAEIFVNESPATMPALGRFVHSYPRRLSLRELLGPGNAVAEDAILLAFLQSEIIRDVDIELFLTAVRRELLALHVSDGPMDESLFDFACALAAQCFLNEYVYSLSDDETRSIAQLKDRVAQAGVMAAAADLAILGCYLPLHALAGVEKLVERSWPKAMEALLVRQVREPLAEAADIAVIPALTSIDQGISRQVQEQYESSPYPRWTSASPARPTTLKAFLNARFGLTGAFDGDILIAGCGTGEHSLDTARNFPQSNILAIDISRTSLAYARRKSREYEAYNVEYGQADILRLGALNRSFDLIESVGVLHHMADPEAGWRALRPLLRRGGVMRIALYSEIARRKLDPARALIAKRGYGPNPDDIRKWRQELIKEGAALCSSDFFSISSCRDLCFHVMEHRFTLPRVQRFLADNQLAFLGMETSAETRELFLQENQAPGALADLDRWDAFEQAHPFTFSEQYYLWLRASA